MSAIKRKKNKHFQKTIWIYLFTSIFLIAAATIYSFLAGKMRSSYLDYMFLYPLLGGSFFFGIVGYWADYVLSFKSYRFAYNAYNCGIATVTVSSFLRGIMEIANVSSAYNDVLFLVGLIFITVGLIIIMRIIFIKINTEGVLF